jgi:hypothetical protein
LRLVWKVAIGLGGIVGTIASLFWAVQQFRQELLVDPYISYDSKEAFQQQFTITNNGPFAVYDVHYLCAVSQIRLNDGSFGAWPDNAMYVMFPVLKPHVTLRWKERANTECDFIARFGTDLKAANIEIIVRYKRWLRDTQIEQGWKFTGKRM